MTVLFVCCGEFEILVSGREIKLRMVWRISLACCQVSADFWCSARL